MASTSSLQLGMSLIRPCTWPAVSIGTSPIAYAATAPIAVAATPARMAFISLPGNGRKASIAVGKKLLGRIIDGAAQPLDGLGPQEIGIDQLLRRLAAEPIEELILATNLTVEGEATAHFIGEHAAALGVAVSRIAHGVPLGGELEFVDGGTLAHAFASRRQMAQ